MCSHMACLYVDPQFDFVSASYSDGEGSNLLACVMATPFDIVSGTTEEITIGLNIVESGLAGEQYYHALPQLPSTPSCITSPPMACTLRTYNMCAYNMTRGCET